MSRDVIALGTNCLRVFKLKIPNIRLQIVDINVSVVRLYGEEIITDLEMNCSPVNI